MEVPGVSACQFLGVSFFVCQPLAMLLTHRAVLHGMAKGVPHLVRDSLPADLGRNLSANGSLVVSVHGEGVLESGRKQLVLERQ